MSVCTEVKSALPAIAQILTITADEEGILGGGVFSIFRPLNILNDYGMSGIEL